MEQPFKEKIEEIMWAENSGRLQFPMLSVLSFFYGILVRARLLLFRAGMLRAKKLPCPVVSVGNITTGGSGKTPVVAALCQMLTAKGHSVVVLSRGYKRQSSGTIIVSDKDSVILDVKGAGDEPFLLATKCKGVPVIVGSDRFVSGRLAIEKFSPDLIILDDGFQHIKLKRDLDLLLFDAKRGMGSGRMIPRGPLREPKSSIARADVIMIKGKGALQKNHKFDQQTFTFYYAPTKLIDLAGKSFPSINTLRGKKVVALSALASTESFYLTLKGCGAKIVERLSFPDHHWFLPTDIERIKEFAKDADCIVTTEKDLVRLDPSDFTDFSLFALAIEARISNANGLLKIIEAKLPSNPE